MNLIQRLCFSLAILLVVGGSSAFAQGPVAQGWGVGLDASRARGGHAVVQVEKVQSPEMLWQVSAGPYVGTLNGLNPCWKGLKGEVLSGSVYSVGALVFPAQEKHLGASWFLGIDLSREQAKIQRGVEDALQLPGGPRTVMLQTREEARLVAGAQWSVGSHLAARIHIGMGAVRERLSSRFEGEEVSSMPMARPAGLALIWRW